MRNTLKAEQKKRDNQNQGVPQMKF